MPCSGRTQRRLSVEADAAPQRIDLGQGKARTMRRDRLGQHVGGGAARAVDDREQDAVALLQLLAREAGLAQEAFERLRRAPTRAGPSSPPAPARSRRAGRARSARGGAGSRRSRSPRRARPALPARPRTAARDRPTPSPASARGFPRSEFEEEIRHSRGSDREASSAVEYRSQGHPLTPPTRSSPSTPGTRPSPGRARGRYRPGARRPRSRRAPAAVLKMWLALIAWS